ncbi:MAG TPA: hypothetical protein DCE52_14275 [Rhodobacteraceae bacterium]|nr:hypothetical protein [Paracoccaceae bacterium]
MANYADKRKKKLKTTKSNSGAQLYMSDKAKEQMLNRPFGGTEIEKLIKKSVTNRMLEGKMDPKESGKLRAETYIDMLDRTYDQDKPKVAKKKYGGKVAKMEAGGEVPSKYKGFSKLPESVQRNMDSDLAQKYEYGGEVSGNSRGGGAALRGTKFSGCK